MPLLTFPNVRTRQMFNQGIICLSNDACLGLVGIIFYTHPLKSVFTIKVEM